MNQDFDQRFDSFRHNDENKDDDKKAEPTEYKSSTSIRNLCFVWPDGRMKFLNYAYLISAEYLPIEEKIQLRFSTDNLTLTGVRLKLLFDKLLQHVTMYITAVDDRYNDVADDGYLVNEILEE